MPNKTKPKPARPSRAANKPKPKPRIRNTVTRSVSWHPDVLVAVEAAAYATDRNFSQFVQNRLRQDQTVKAFLPRPTKEGGR